MQSTFNRVHNIKIIVDHILKYMYIPNKAQYRKKAKLKNVKICIFTLMHILWELYSSYSFEVQISKWQTEKNTFGWIRAEVLGALVNAVFLVALCFTILVEALKRLVEFEEVNNPKPLLIVGGAGLLVNVIGLFLFHDHGRDKGGMPKKNLKN